MRSQWGEMWPLAYLIGALERFSSSLSLELRGGTWLFINTRSFYPDRPSSSILAKRPANNTQACFFWGGFDTTGLQHTCAYRVALSGQDLCTNTSDTLTGNETPWGGQIERGIYIYDTTTTLLLGWWPFPCGAGLVGTSIGHSQRLRGVICTSQDMFLNKSTGRVYLITMLTWHPRGKLDQEVFICSCFSPPRDVYSAEVSVGKTPSLL